MITSDTFLLIRALLYPVAAYGFFLLATFRPPAELPGHRLMRHSCYALAALMLLIGVKIVIQLQKGDTLWADAIITPVLMAVIVLVYGGVAYMTRPTRNHNHAHPLSDRDSASARD